MADHPSPLDLSQAATPPRGSGACTLQKGDRVRKMTGDGKEEEGVVSDIAEDGNVVVNRDKGGKWKKQNAQNFNKIETGVVTPQLEQAAGAGPKDKADEGPAHNGELLGVRVPERAAAAGEGAWYEKHPEAAFPPEFSGSFAGSAAGSAPVQLIRQPILRDAEGVFRHGRSKIGDEAALGALFQRLEQCYPSRFGHKQPHPSETAAQRSQRCNAPAARSDCWNLLDRELLQKLWKDRSRRSKILPSSVPDFVKGNEKYFGFRTDMFGNVVTFQTGPKATCAFEVVARSSIQMLVQILILILMLLLVATARAIPPPMLVLVFRLKLTLKLNADGNQVDHIFPWARGGKSTRDNFAAVYWGANIFKSDKILHGAQLVDSANGGWVSQVFECDIMWDKGCVCGEWGGGAGSLSLLVCVCEIICG